MSKNYYTIEELTLQLGREKRSVEKQVSRGHIPGRRVSGEWRFNKTEITDWLEREMASFNESDLAVLERSQKSTEVSTQSVISSLLHPDLIEVPLDAGTKPSVLKKLVEVAGRTWQVFDSSAVFQAVRQREDFASTGFNGGVAIPHPQNRMPEALGESLIAFGRTVSGIPFGGPNRQLTDLFFLVLARDPNTHLKALARLGRLFQVDGFLEDLRHAETSADSYDVITAADANLGE
ncbi:PTS sugar transporter subunit IIA [Fuerstiella marisgermanici]|uniref:EIIABC-Fru n=1 Tax=Fuerstiella marisgermanici TaxID=1891926 RepID=A0A1P8WEL0_9PLAN|nr:PTS sugar transporter subunit IIA [Fuerstiella marisgermanici]APZ92503.1 EIIABC-Fru [Fuerstiella marisgermanici]